MSKRMSDEDWARLDAFIGYYHRKPQNRVTHLLAEARRARESEAELLGALRKRHSCKVFSKMCGACVAITKAEGRE